MQDSYNACGWQEQKEVKVPLPLFAFVCFDAETGKQELASVLVYGMGEEQGNKLTGEDSSPL